ncbi:hypothetical protein G7Z17_g3507 [Cylindrodendrum hubeiense]|uniref:Uncharacterized protein n=1 Tax=Cylindrodendrum hubeiense TaxID=595255 RepID=A0A9P5HL20_9HYPO|nr:hypothetical protein G7Z17_g3507 [Cylindrodendrum hubeiense]
MADTRNSKRIKLEMSSPSYSDALAAMFPDALATSDPSCATLSTRGNPDYSLPDEADEHESDEHEDYEGQADKSDIVDSTDPQGFNGSISADPKDADDEPVQANTPDESLASDVVPDGYNTLLLDRLDSLRGSGQVFIRPGHRIILDHDCLPVIQVPPPIISRSELIHLENRLKRCPTLSPSWREFLQAVKYELSRGKSSHQTWTHAHVWGLVQVAHRETMSEINSLEAFSEDLIEHPSSIR